MMKKRHAKPELDILRIMACFAVIMLHVSAKYWSVTDVNSFDWKVMNFYDSAMRGSVPIFVMLSGYLFLNKSELPTIKMLFGKYILKLVLLYLFWGLFYAIDLIGLKNISCKSLTNALTSFCINPKVHLWFLPSMVGVYLLIPILWTVVKYENGKYVNYVCLLFVIFGVVWPTVKLFLPAQKELSYVLNRFTYALSGYGGYFILGYYLGNKECKRKPIFYVVAYVLVVVVGAKIGQLDAVAAGEPRGILYNNFSLMTFFEAVFIFLAVTKYEFKTTICKEAFLSKLSGCTLFIYGFHMFVIEHLDEWYSINGKLINPVLGIPLVSLMTFVISGVFALLFKICKASIESNKERTC